MNQLYNPGYTNVSRETGEIAPWFRPPQQYAPQSWDMTASPAFTQMGVYGQQRPNANRLSSQLRPHALSGAMGFQNQLHFGANGYGSLGPQLSNALAGMSAQANQNAQRGFLRDLFNGAMGGGGGGGYSYQNSNSRQGGRIS